jgi:predicted ATPase
MPIPKNISDKDIVKATQRIKATSIPPSRESERYFLVYGDESFPPKYVISVANYFTNGIELDPSMFNTYEAQDYLRDLKFTIVDIKEKNFKNHNGFKLISLDIRNNKLLGTNFYDFIEDEDNENEIYTTVIIGPNGTGKSNLFRIIVGLMRELQLLKNGRSRTYEIDGQFSLKYAVGNALYDFTNFRNYRKTKHANFDDQKYYTYLLKDGQIIDYSNGQLPEAIIANSIMLTDKFPVPKDKAQEEDFSIYKYLGVRNRPQQASTRSYVRRTVEFIVENISSATFKTGLNRVAQFLTNSSAIVVSFYTSNTTKFFRGKLTVESFRGYFDAISDRYAESTQIPPFKLNYYRQIMHDSQLIEALVSYCNSLYDYHRLEDIYKSATKLINFDITDETGLQLLKQDFGIIDKLRQLGMVSAPEITIGNEQKYNLQESSSGEYHFFSSMVGLMATIKPNSLIFIDEPEISLHPNWQMRYLSFLREIFSKAEFATSHILLATHSHFIISDLQGRNSKIIGLKKQDGKIAIVDFPKDMDTYGWSAEDVLYNIFNVRSTWNYFLEADLTELLGMISNNIRNPQKINILIEKLEKLPKRPNDPLQEIILEAKEYLETIQ